MQNVLRKEKHPQIKPYIKWTLFLQGGLGIIHYASLKAGLPLSLKHLFQDFLPTTLQCGF